MHEGHKTFCHVAKTPLSPESQNRLEATCLKVSYICLSFMHDCVLFRWPGFCFLESTFDFQWSARNCSFPRQCWHYITAPSDCSGHASVCFSQAHHKGPTLYSQTPKLQLTHWCSRCTEYARGDPNQEVSLFWTFSLIIRILAQSKTIWKKIFSTVFLPSLLFLVFSALGLLSCSPYFFLLTLFFWFWGFALLIFLFSSAFCLLFLQFI